MGFAKLNVVTTISNRIISIMASSADFIKLTRSATKEI